jgi:hypothetical protein
MSFTDGMMIKESDVHSYRTFGLQIKSRKIGLPEKKSIRQTVPFMNGYYDFTTLNGEPTWSERIIEFTFDILENTPQLLEAKIDEILAWLTHIHDKDIFDDVIPDYLWHGSYESSEINYDESGIQAELKVSFVVYPFKIQYSRKTYGLKEADGTKVISNRGMAVPLYITAVNVGGTLTIDGQTITYSGDERSKKTDYILSHSDHTASVVGGNVILGFHEELI